MVSWRLHPEKPEQRLREINWAESYWWTGADGDREAVVGYNNTDHYKVEVWLSVNRGLHILFSQKPSYILWNFTLIAHGNRYFWYRGGESKVAFPIFLLWNTKTSLTSLVIRKSTGISPSNNQSVLQCIPLLSLQLNLDVIYLRRQQIPQRDEIKKITSTFDTNHKFQAD